MTMFNFFKKKIKTPNYDVASQVAMALKSVTIPDVAPKWRLFARKNHNWNTKTAIEEGYNASAVVYACVEKRAKLISSVPWVAKVKLADGNLENAPDSRLQKLLNKPNPDLSMLEIVYSISQMMDLSGNAYLSEIKAGARNEVTQLWPLPSQFMSIKPGTVGIIGQYEYQENSSTKFTVEKENMVHLKNPNPNSHYFGMPVLMSAGRATDIDREAGEWQKKSFENRGVTDIHVEVPDTMSQEDAITISDTILERNGGTENARKPLVTSGKVNLLNQNAKEMDFANSKQKVWSEICAAFGMSVSDLGLTENVNLSNAEAMAKQLWVNTIIPQLDLIQAQFNTQLASEFGEEFVICYDLSNVRALQENYGEKLENATKLKGIGFSAKAINDRLELGFTEEQLPDEAVEPDPEPIKTEDPAKDEDPKKEDVEQADEMKRLVSELVYGK